MPVARRIAWGIALWAYVGSASAQTPVSVTAPEAEPQLPTGIVPHDVNIDGQLAYLWADPEGYQVIHIVGDFTMRVGGRSLRAEQGIIWMTDRQYEKRPYRSFEVFLFRSARIVEPAGTVTEGPLLYVTLGSSGEVFLSVDKRAFASSAETTVYRDAAAVRDRVRARGVGVGVPEPLAPLTVTLEELEIPLPPPEFSFSAKQISISRLEDGQQIVTCIGGVNLFRGAVGGGDTLELLADSAVVFLKGGALEEMQNMPLLSAERGAAEDVAGMGVEAVYLGGDIRISVGDRTIRASQAYYDLVYDRALILDAVAFAMIPGRNLPIYLRAARIRQLSNREWAAQDAMLTTSEFHTPHYHIGAQRVELIDRTPPTLFGEPAGLTRAHYRVVNPTFSLYNVPILFWPWSAGKVSVSDTALRRFSTGYDGSFGLRVETDWDLFNLLSFEAPEGFTADLSLDYLSQRGPAAGLDVVYERDDYYGSFQSYLIDDRGDDRLGRFRANERDRDSRGRLTWRHRHFLPEDWELSFEISYESDRAFLEEYFESEFDEGKERETFVYLKKQRDNWAFTVLGQVRLNDFYTQTERFGDFSFQLVGEPVGDFGSWFSENRAGVVRYRSADKEFFILLTEGSDGPSSGATARIDSRQEITIPIRLGPVNVVPFFVVRGSGWDDTPSRSLFSLFARDGGGAGRFFAGYGFRSSMYFWRVYDDFKNTLLDVDGIRHVIKPQVVAWASHSNRDSDELFPFDESVEGIDDFDGVLLGVQQRWQTKRGAGENRRVVDWITWDVQLGLFNDGRASDVTNGFVSFTRPEDSVSRNFLNSAFIWRVNDATAVLSELNWDLNDGEIDVFDIGVQVDRTPRFSYGLDYRFIEETDSNLLGVGLNYKIDAKHSIAVREAFDLAGGRTLDFTVAYIRKYPRWYVALAFELDEAQDNAGVSLSIWPEGLRRTAIGSRRFTGLATSTALKPNF
ncbi:MAG: hypothetical protein V3W34_13360 [Phycisphaerae bacterium]